MLLKEGTITHSLRGQVGDAVCGQIARICINQYMHQNMHPHTHTHTHTHPRPTPPPHTHTRRVQKLHWCWG